jgi:hypothetical protein
MKKRKSKKQKETSHKVISNPDFGKMEIAMITARLALPMEKRTGFLRKRLPNGGSCL